jgi:DNA repair exonuclease SbcCD nuclease subunit
MIKKIIHIADIHIRTFRMHDEYREVFNIFIKQLRTYCKNYKYEEIRIAIVGDLVHQKITISNEQLMLSCKFLNELSKIGKVVLIAGNHDLLENNKDRMDSISPMIELLDNPNISYYKERLCYQDDNVVWCNYSIFEHNERPDIEGFKSVLDSDLSSVHLDSFTFIGLYHAPLVGATTDIGYEFKEGTELTIFEGCDLVLLGDIHKRQYFEHKGIPIAYPSSLIQQNFGETVSKHGYLIWDVESKTYLEKDIETRYGFYTFKIKSLEDIENGTEVLTNK